MDTILFRQLQAVSVAACQQLRIAGPSCIDRPHRVDDVFGFQAISFGDFGLPSLAAIQCPALCQQLRAGRTVNGAVYSAAAQQALVGRIDDTLYIQLGDIT